MSDVKLLLEKTETKGAEIIGFVSKHRTVIIIFVACAAILVAVMQTQSYLNPDRNEDKYTEIKSSISIKQLDQEVLNKLQKTQGDVENTADSNFVLDRTNPFTE